MCTSILFNGKKTIVGWNFDNPGYEYKIIENKDMVYISLKDHGYWMPVFGCNAKGNFITLPTTNPHYEISTPTKDKLVYNIIDLNYNLLMNKTTFEDMKKICEENIIYSMPKITFQAQNTDKFGNVLQIFTGFGYRYLEHPRYSVLTNFQLIKEEQERHPWAGVDRYDIATKMLKQANDDFDVNDCFKVLEATSQIIVGCPTQVSMVFDVSNNHVYWCENREYNNIKNKIIEE